MNKSQKEIVESGESSIQSINRVTSEELALAGLYNLATTNPTSGAMSLNSNGVIPTPNRVIPIPSSNIAITCPNRNLNNSSSKKRKVSSSPSLLSSDGASRISPPKKSKIAQLKNVTKSMNVAYLQEQQLQMQQQQQQQQFQNMIIFQKMNQAPPNVVYQHLYGAVNNNFNNTNNMYAVQAQQQFFQQALLQANMANLPPNIATANLTTLPPGYNLPPAFNQQSNHVVAYNNAKIDELSAKEEHRREQKRIYARTRRQNKRNILERAEFECNRLGVLQQAYKMQMKTLDAHVRIKIGRALGVISRINRRPVWQQMMKNAQDELQAEEERRNRENGNKNASGNKSLDVRRQRNRLSAKMSRLRKRVRLEFLEKTAINLKAQIDCLRQHLGAVNAAKVAALDLGAGRSDSNVQLGILSVNRTSSNGSGKDNNHQTTNGNKSKIERKKTAVAIEKREGSSSNSNSCINVDEPKFCSSSSSSTKASTTTTKTKNTTVAEADK